MERNLFNIRTAETTKTPLGRTRIVTEYAVEYKGVEILRSRTQEVAARCVEDAVAIRSDAQWAFEESLRADGFEIPHD